LTFDILLQPDPGLVGKVLDPDGTPAEGASVAVCTSTNEVTVSGGKLRYGSHAQQLRQLVETARDGSSRVPGECDDWVLVFAHDSGYAEATAGEFAASSTVTLKTWGRVEGALVVDGKGVSNTTISVGAGRGDAQVVLHYSADATTDAVGQFAVERVTPVKQYVGPRFRLGQNSYNLLWVSGHRQIEPGKTTHVSLPRTGRPVVGRIMLPPESGLKRSELAIVVSVVLRPPSVSGGLDWVERSHQAYSQFMNSDVGKAFRRENVPVDSDGSFRIEWLPETSYVLFVSAYEKTDPAQTDPRKSLASYSRRVEVPPLDDGQTPVDLGDVVLTTRTAKK